MFSRNGLSRVAVFGVLEGDLDRQQSHGFRLPEPCSRWTRP